MRRNGMAWSPPAKTTYWAPAFAALNDPFPQMSALIVSLARFTSGTQLGNAATRASMVLTFALASRSYTNPFTAKPFCAGPEANVSREPRKSDFAVPLRPSARVFVRIKVLLPDGNVTADGPSGLRSAPTHAALSGVTLA